LLNVWSPGQVAESPVLSLSALEKQHIARVIEMAVGHKGRAADLLGVTRPRLNRLLEKFGLQ